MLSPKEAEIKATELNPWNDDKKLQAWISYYEQEIDFCRDMADQLLPDLQEVIFQLTLLKEKKKQLLQFYSLYFNQHEDHKVTLEKLLSKNNASSDSKVQE